LQASSPLLFDWRAARLRLPLMLRLPAQVKLAKLPLLLSARFPHLAQCQW
jgi:hypothetical protein